MQKALVVVLSNNLARRMPRFSELLANLPAMVARILTDEEGRAVLPGDVRLATGDADTSSLDIEITVVVPGCWEDLDSIVPLLASQVAEEKLMSEEVSGIFRVSKLG